MKNVFTKHPHENNETYFEHGKVALCYSFKLFLLSLAALIHAFFPFLFEKTVSKEISKMSNHLEDRFKTQV